MPLTTDPSFAFHEEADVVHFEMADGEKKVSCSVTAQALSDLAKRDDIRHTNNVEIFQACRAEIEVAASSLYDAGESSPRITPDRLTH